MCSSLTVFSCICRKHVTVVSLSLHAMETSGNSLALQFNELGTHGNSSAFFNSLVEIVFALFNFTRGNGPAFFN